MKMKQDGMCQWAPFAGEMGVGSTGDMQWANTTNHEQGESRIG
jgi:hypothetical protein